jgi:2-polyprenyl-3-methyl-5-hydroxy-6-metoxy-1,4-benzoquinol methylase
VSEPVTGKFLDFGCGEGHVVVEAAQKAKISVGYDIKDDNWQRFTLGENAILSTDWEKVKNHASYDAVLLYDVLDHLKDEDEAVSVLKNIRDVLDDKGKIFVRCHPWCSRHGTHLYQSINRAYLHLCLDEENITKLGYKFLPTIKIIHPLQTYDRWFQAAELHTVSWNVVREQVEPFFHQPPIAALIKKNWKDSPEETLAKGHHYPSWQMEQQFVDYVLVKKV